MITGEMYLTPPAAGRRSRRNKKIFQSKRSFAGLERRAAIHARNFLVVSRAYFDPQYPIDRAALRTIEACFRDLSHSTPEYCNSMTLLFRKACRSPGSDAGAEKPSLGD